MPVALPPEEPSFPPLYPHTMKAPHHCFKCSTSSRKLVNTNFEVFGLIGLELNLDLPFDIAINKARYLRVSSEAVDRLHIEALCLLARHRFVQVPQLQRLVFRRRDQSRLIWEKPDRTDSVKVTPQGIFWTPCSPVRFFCSAYLLKSTQSMLPQTIRKTCYRATTSIQ